MKIVVTLVKRANQRVWVLGVSEAGIIRVAVVRVLCLADGADRVGALSRVHLVLVLLHGDGA